MSRAFAEVDRFLGKVTDVLGGVVGGFLENPLPTIATIGLTAVGVPPMVANFAGAALRGGSMEDMALNLATSYLGGQLGEAVSGAAFGDLPLEIAPEMASTATQDLVKSVITNASPAALNAAIKGESFSKVLESAVMGGVSGMIGRTIQSELGLDPRQFDDKLIGGAIDSATKAILGGQDIATAISSSIAQTTIGTALGTASSGLKTAMNELQAKTSDYDTYFGQYENLQTALAADESWLSNKYADLQNLTNTFEAKREDLLGAQENVQLAQAAMGVRPYGGVDLGVGNPHIVKLAENLGWSQVATDDYGGVGYAIPTGRMNYVPKYNEDGYIYAYDSWPETRVIETPDQVIAAVNPYISKLQNEAPQLDALGRQLAQETEAYNGVKTRYENTANQLATVSSTLTNLKGDINNLISTRDQYFTDINDLLGDAVTQIGTEATDITKRIVDTAVDQLADAGGQVDETILGETGFEQAPKGSLAEYVSSAVSDAVKEPPPVEGLEDGDFGFAVEPPVTSSVPIPEPQDIWPETIPQEFEDLGPPITFTPDVTETPEPPQAVEDLGPELTFTPDTTEVREVEDTGEPVIKREEVYPDFFTPPTETVIEPEAVAPELGERVPIAAVEDEEAPALTLNTEQPVTEAPVDLSGLEELFAPPQAVVEEPPVTEEGFGFEISGDQTGTGATSFTDEDGNTFIVDEQGNTYLTGPSGEDLMPSTADFDLSKLPTTADEQALLDYTEQAGKDLAQAQDTQALIDYIEQSGMDLGQAHDAQSLIDYIEQAGADLAQSQADQSYIDYIEQAGQDLAKAHDDQAYIDYIEQAGQDLAKAHDDQAYIDYIEQAGQDLADAQQNLIDSGIVIGDVTGGGGGAGGGGGKPVTPPPVTPPPVTPTPVVQPRGQGLDFLSFLGMLGMMRPTQQPIAAAQPEQEEITPYTSWEELFTPYSDVTYPPQTTRKQR